MIFNLLDKFNAIHARHIDVAQYKVVMIAPNGYPSIHSVYGYIHIVASILQQLSGHFARSNGIIHNKNALAIVAFCFFGFVDNCSNRRMMLFRNISPDS